MHFRLATYNVHKCKGLDWRVSPQRIAHVIENLNAGILTVQEILLSHAEFLSNRLDTPFFFGPARQHAGEPYGNAIFTKYAVCSHESYDLTVTSREPRQCLRISMLLDDGTPLHVFALHLGTSYAERRRQAPLLLNHIKQTGIGSHRVIAGDFNEWTRGLATDLFRLHFQTADIAEHLKRRATYPGVFSFLHLDHIYYDRDFQLQEMHLERTPLSLVASDHLPLTATFTIR